MEIKTNYSNLITVIPSYPFRIILYQAHIQFNQDIIKLFLDFFF